MKIKLILIIVFLISMSSLAQNGINYKAVIKDASNTILTSQAVDVQFTVELYGIGIYQEEHITTTDANGIVILNIGEGTTTDDFTTIPWNSDAISLSVAVDIGDGWVNMGSSDFKTVPYAFHAFNAASKVDDLSDGKSDSDGTSNGSSVFLGVQAGYLDDESNNQNVGIGYNALSVNTSGYYNSAVGYQTLDSNTSGFSNTAVGYKSLNANTTGYSNTAIGSQALFSNTDGLWNTATGIQALQNNTIGDYNTANGNLAQYGNTTGRFNSGFGGDAMRHNTSGSYNVSVGYRSGYNANGSNNTFLGQRAGLGSTLRNISGSVFIGNQAGSNETISNRLYIDNSGTTAPLIYGNFSSNYVRINGSMGINASGSNPLTVQSSTNDSYISYTSTNGYKGYSGIYSGNNDMDFGTGVSNTTGKVHLVTSASPKLTVDSDGDVGIGTQNPTRDLDVVGSGRFSGTLNVNNLWVGNFAYLSSAYINSVSRLSVSTNLVPSAEFSYNLGLSNRRWLSVWANDGTINTSDRRDKTDIQDMSYGLKDIMQLEPVSFLWRKRQHDGKKLGLIAQDLLQVIPEVVKTHEDIKDEKTGGIQRREAERMGVYYSDLIPVLIKAIQELKQENDALTSKLNTKDDAFNALVLKVNQIETLLKTTQQ